MTRFRVIGRFDPIFLSEYHAAMLPRPLPPARTLRFILLAAAALAAGLGTVAGCRRTLPPSEPLSLEKPLALFAGHGDLGPVKHAGSVREDAGDGALVVSGAGANILLQSCLVTPLRIQWQVPPVRHAGTPSAAEMPDSGSPKEDHAACDLEWKERHTTANNNDLRRHSLWDYTPAHVTSVWETGISHPRQWWLTGRWGAGD